VPSGAAANLPVVCGPAPTLGTCGAVRGLEPRLLSPGFLRECGLTNSYLVDPASSHMLVSKIKPCMSKYKQLYTVKLRTAHYISNNLFDGSLLHG
jgi:hypothetical protein